MSNLVSTIDYKKYKRFFAFGCSFTHYFWPTWADIIATEIPESYNYGMCGGGNGFIFNRIIEANQRHKFDENDLIIVMWTNTAREDRYLVDRWTAFGNIYSQDSNSIYTPDVVKKIACERGYYIRDMGYLTAINLVLKNLKSDYDFLAVIPLQQATYLRKEWSDRNPDVTDMYRDSLESIKTSVFQGIYNYNWENRPRIKTAFWSPNAHGDFHPSPEVHLEYLQYIYPDMLVTSRMLNMLDREMTAINQLPHLTKTNYVFNRRTISRL
jgi:hypothetical protein